MIKKFLIYSFIVFYFSTLVFGLTLDNSLSCIQDKTFNCGVRVVSGEKYCWCDQSCPSNKDCCKDYLTICENYNLGWPFCWDSDNGDIYLKGDATHRDMDNQVNGQKIIGGVVTDNDACVSDYRYGYTTQQCDGEYCRLYEYKCVDSLYGSQPVKIVKLDKITCPGGCKNGVCLKPYSPDFECYEYNCQNPDCSIVDTNNPIPSDKNQYRKTKVISIDKNTNVPYGGLDYCTFGSLGTGSYVEGLAPYVRENYCDSNYIAGGVRYEEIKCDNGCYDGACVEKVQLKIDVKDDNPQGSGGSVKLTYSTLAGSVQEYTITEQNPQTISIQKGITVTLEPFVNNG
ncbi:MAG: hypothetical protein AABY14_01665, partial [Nanoarchaeota archaeon]